MTIRELIETEKDFYWEIKYCYEAFMSDDVPVLKKLEITIILFI